MAPLGGATGKSSAGGSGRPLKIIPAVPLSLAHRQRTNPRSQPARVEPHAKDKEGGDAQDGEKANRKEANDAAKSKQPATHHAGNGFPNGDGTSPTPNGKADLPTPSLASFASNAIPDTPVAPSATPPDSRASPTPTRRRARPQLPPQQPNGDHAPPARMPVFGGFHESKASSPAPYPPSSFPPPEFMPYPPDGPGPGHGPPGPGPAVDHYGRLMLVSPIVDGFPPPAMNHHGPPTPHSFHGSQSSMHAPDDNGFSHPFSVSNGHNGYPLHHHHHHMGQQPPRPLGAVDPRISAAGLLPVVGSGGGSSPDFGGVSRMQLQTLNFLRAAVEQPDFSDCTLELNLVGSAPTSDPRGNHLRIPCHRFILAQSPTLKHLLQTRGTAPDGTLRIELQDQYMRSEAFYFTLRTLYGWDFGDDFLPTYLGFQGVKDKFDLALGYIAAARYLQLPLVHASVVHYACCRLIHWETIEQACQFALPSAIFGHPVASHDQPHNGPASDSFGLAELLDAIVAFVVNCLPLHFVLDTSVGDCGFPRLPLSGPVPASASNKNHKKPAPAIAHGTSKGDALSHSRHPSSANARARILRSDSLSANPRLSQIQFGDLAPEENGGGGANQAGRPPAASPTPWDSILSRILLNLPFPMLKQILEHPGLAKPSGDLSMAARHGLITSVVAEREARRQHNLGVAAADAQIQVFGERLEEAGQQPLAVRQMGDFLVNSMGFKEEVFPGDVPYLVQSWDRQGA